MTTVLNFPRPAKHICETIALINQLEDKGLLTSFVESRYPKTVPDWISFEIYGAKLEPDALEYAAKINDKFKNDPSFRRELKDYLILIGSFVIGQ